MKKPAHTPTKSIRGDPQPQANNAERQDTPRQDNGMRGRRHVRLGGEVTRTAPPSTGC